MLDFDTIKKYYDKKYWSVKMVRNAVAKEYITADEFAQITGESY